MEDHGENKRSEETKRKRVRDREGGKETKLERVRVVRKEKVRVRVVRREKERE